MNRERVYKLTISIIPLLYSVSVVFLIWYSKAMHDHGYNWTIGGWLVNYSDGFVRRGLSGLIVFSLSDFIHVDPTIMAALLISAVYMSWVTIFLISAFKLTDFTYYALICLSPLIIIFPGDSGVRKEITLFLLLSLGFTTKKDNNKIYFIASLAYPFLILIHEAIFVGLPAIIGIAFIRKIKSKIYYAWNITASVLAFAACLMFRGNPSSSLKLCQYLLKHGIQGYCGGAIQAIGKNPGFYLKYMSPIPWVESVFLLMAMYLIPLLFILYIYIRKTKDNYIIYVSFLLSIILVFPLFFVATDWGRFLRLVFICLISIIFTSAKINDNLIQINTEWYKSSIINPTLYSLLTTFLIIESIFMYVGNSHGIYYGFSNSIVGRLIAYSHNIYNLIQ